MSPPPVVTLTLKAAAAPAESQKSYLWNCFSLLKTRGEKITIKKQIFFLFKYKCSCAAVPQGTGPSDSLRGSCCWLKVTWCIYTLTTETEGPEQEGGRRRIIVSHDTGWLVLIWLFFNWSYLSTNAVKVHPVYLKLLSTSKF